MSVSQSNFLSQWRKIVIYCYIKKITYIVSKSRTLLYNSSVIPSTQRQKNECEFSPMWNFIWTNYGSLTLKNVKSCSSTNYICIYTGCPKKVFVYKKDQYINEHFFWDTRYVWLFSASIRCEKMKTKLRIWLCHCIYYYNHSWHSLHPI